jgi:hypothetical protein
MIGKQIAYWVSTVLVVGVMIVSGALSLLHTPEMMKGFAHLGYPAYFANIIGVAKVAGVCVLLIPGFGLVKEWAYAGFGIVLISASISHFSSGDGIASAEPLFFFAMLIVSYLTRPANRRTFGSITERTPMPAPARLSESEH